MLALRQRFWSEEALERPLEEIALFEASYLEFGGPRCRKLDEGRIEQREANRDAGQLCRSRDLEEVIVADRKLEIEVEEAVELNGPLDSVVVTLQHRVRLVFVDRRTEVRVEQLRRLLRHQELPGIEASRVRDVGAAHVAARSVDEPWHVITEIEKNRFDDPGAKCGRYPAVAGEDSIDSIALVAPEDFVPAVTGKEGRHTALVREAGAEEGPDRRSVPKRLVVGFDEAGQALQGVIGRHDTGVVRSAEVTGGDFRIPQLVVLLLPEADGKRVDAVDEPPHQPDNGAAVGPATEERADFFGGPAA